MSVTVTMPQLGESVTEGTVTRWLKQVGEEVRADEPLVEVSTDKVDTEIPAPASGVLLSIAAGEDETVAVGAPLGVIGAAGDAPSGDAPAAPAAPEAAAPRRPRRPHPPPCRLRRPPRPWPLLRRAQRWRRPPRPLRRHLAPFRRTPTRRAREATPSPARRPPSSCPRWVSP